MPMIDASRFIRSVSSDSNLRTRLNQASSRKELLSVLNTASFDFSYADFEDAYRVLLVKCQSECQAQNLRDLKNWWDMLLLFTPE